MQPRPAAVTACRQVLEWRNLRARQPGYDAFFGTNARNRFGFSTMILRIVASFTPAYRSLGKKTIETDE